MNSVNDWCQVIPSYMAHYNNYFKNQSGDKYHLLFVEGSNDNKFFYGFFNRAYEKTAGEYDFRLLKEDILFDFSNRFNSVNDFGRLRYSTGQDESVYTNNREEELRQSSQNIKEELGLVTSDRGFLVGSVPYQNFYFVLECLKDYNLKKYQYIDCFGFVDRDCNQHNSTVKGVEQLCQSKFHDRETNLVRNCLIDFVNKYAGDDIGATRRVVAKILLFTTKQGIGEKASLACGYGYGQVSSRAKKYFNDNVYRNDFRDFSFESHFSNVYSVPVFRQKAAYYINRECDMLLPGERINSEVEFDGKLLDIIINWLSGKDEYENTMDEVFRLSNGHYLLQQLFNVIKSEKNNRVLFKFMRAYSDRDLLSLIFVENRENIVEAFEIAPLRDYREYRDNLACVIRRENNR